VKVGLRCPESFRRRAVYAVDTLFDILAVPYRLAEEPEGKLDLYWGPPGPEIRSRIVIPLISPEKWESEEWKVTEIEGVPILHVGDEPSKLYSVEGQVTFGFDLLSPFFYLLSRYEECVNPKPDEFGRFRAGDSVLHRLNLLGRPILNSYVRLLKDAFRRCGLPEGEPLWPEGRRFAVALSHDVDIPRKSIAGSLRIILRQLLGKEGLEDVSVSSQVGSLLDLAKAGLSGGENPYWNFKRWVELEERHGFTSCFYLASVREGEVEDPKYDLTTDGALRDMAGEISRRGFGVGLHGSLRSADEVRTLKEQKESLERLCGLTAFGVRQHYLRMKLPQTWRVQEEAGFLYDSSLGYSDKIGFRCGLAFPFRPYDLGEERRLNILELPLNIMDGTVFAGRGKGREEALSTCLGLLDRIEEENGLAVILWHLRSWYERDFPGWRWVYEHILSHLATKEAWVTSPGEIATWWRKRGKSIPQS
jgi:hypothetical protein